MNGDAYAIKVQKVAASNGFDHTGKVVPIVTLTYTVGDHGPFTEEFTKEEFANTAAVQAKLREMQTSIRTVTSY